MSIFGNVSEYEKEKRKAFLISIRKTLNFDSVDEMISHYENLANSEDIRVVKYAKLMLSIFDFIVTVESDFDNFTEKVERIYFGEDGTESMISDYREETYDLIDDILKAILAYAKSINYKPSKDVKELLDNQ